MSGAGTPSSVRWVCWVGLLTFSTTLCMMHCTSTHHGSRLSTTANCLPCLTTDTISTVTTAVVYTVTLLFVQVDEARKVLLDALHDAWPSDEYIDIFARTAAKICIQQAFVLGKTVPYEQTIVHAPNMGTHLHKCGIGMVRGTLQQMLARPEIQPYFKLTVWPKNTPPNILCLLANVFSGHPSDLVNDIVEQTYLVEPGVDEPYVLPPSIPSRSSFSTRPVLDKSADSDSASEASSISHTSVPAEVVASPPHQVADEPEPLMSVSSQGCNLACTCCFYIPSLPGCHLLHIVRCRCHPVP